SATTKQTPPTAITRTSEPRKETISSPLQLSTSGKRPTALKINGISATIPKRKPSTTCRKKTSRNWPQSRFANPGNITSVSWPGRPATLCARSPASSAGMSPPPPNQSPDFEPQSMTLRKKRKKPPKSFREPDRPAKKSAFGNSLPRPESIPQISTTHSPENDAPALKLSQNSSIY